MNFVLVNPSFNQDEWWWDGALEADARWKYGTPSKCNGTTLAYNSDIKASI
ncbi:MAG: hypothetical protein ACEQSQ_09000 [Candidatus Paceibacteria bacterium]